MSACGADEVWSLMCRLADVLPPDVVLVINTRLHGPRPITVTLKRPPDTLSSRHQLPPVIARG